jgi:glycosyltransferase involved in cell wall biosynthesis
MNILQLHREGVYPPTNGGETRVWKTAEALSDNASITLATPVGQDYPNPDINSINIRTELLSGKIPRIFLWNLSFLDGMRTYPKVLSRRVMRDLKKVDEQFDLIISESPQVFLPSLHMADLNNAQLLINKHNAYFNLVRGYLLNKSIPSPIIDRISSNIRDFERFCVSNSDIAIFQSKSDLELFSDTLPQKSGVIPNGTDFDEINTGNCQKGRKMLDIDPDMFVCAFVGSYDYAPNKQAAEFIAERIAPQLPDVEFLLIGRDPPTFDEENVRCPGYVKDYADALAAADVALCPLMFGSGTKLKMLDYLAASLPIITTQIGTQGIPIDSNNALIKEDPEGFIQAIHRLRSDPVLSDELSAKSEQLGRKYDWDALLSQYWNYIG